MKTQISAIQNKFEHAEASEVLSWFLDSYKDFTAFSTSLGPEDQVITQMLVSLGLPVKIFTLDTGRLFQQTYDLLDITAKKYNLDIQVFFPEHSLVEEMVNTKGINLFYENIENRRFCCSVRKLGAWCSTGGL